MSSSQPAPSSHAQEVTNSVQSIIDSNCNALLTKMQDGHAGADVGISVALFYPNDSSIPSFFQYGWAGPNEVITSETVYAIGSVTKVFTASLAAFLSVEGMIGALDQTPVAPYLYNPGCNPSGVSGPYWDGDQVNFMQFATQTSGMPDEANGPYGDQLFAGELPSCQQLSWWNGNQPEFMTNLNYWIYSSAGFVTLGFAVAAAVVDFISGGYPGVLRQVITTPLGMPSTFAAQDLPRELPLAQGYNNNNAVSILNAADLKSNAQDMLTWLGAVYEAMELQASGGTLTSLQQALASAASVWIEHPRKPDGQYTDFAMGLGWQIPTINSAQVLMKDGLTSKGGCSCWIGLTRYASDVPPVGIALLTNQDWVGPDSTARTILQQIMDLG